MYRYFDAHSHIHGQEYDSDREEVLARMKENGVGTITVGTHLESSKAAVGLAHKEEGVWASIGLHPTDTDENFDFDQYQELVAHPKVVAIGECGLDYFRLGVNAEEEKVRQKKNFWLQLEFAVTHAKPLMIHCRPSGKTMDAHLDMLSILEARKRTYGDALWGNIHFFTGTPEIAKRYFDLGFTISISGIITFTDEYDALIKESPIEKLLSETDSPYATPVPFRGKRNEPVFVIETIKEMAALRGILEEEMALKLSENLRRVFGV